MSIISTLSIAIGELSHPHEKRKASDEEMPVIAHQITHTAEILNVAMEEFQSDYSAIEPAEN